MHEFFRRVEPYLTPLLAFSGLFLVSMIVLSFVVTALVPQLRALYSGQLIFIGSAIVATAICVFSIERGKWMLGILVPLRQALGETLIGTSAALALVCGTHLLIIAASDYATTRGDGFDWILVLGLLFPAAFGEELVFRGYVLQRLYDRSAAYAVIVTSALFALVHAGNPAIGPLALLNIFLAGVLFAFMWAWGRSLWMPVWAHFAWNVISGPVLGHELSGQAFGATVFSESDPGPRWLTGGDFGIEASVILTMAELVAIVLIIWRIRSRDRTLEANVIEAGADTQATPDSMSGGIDQN